MFNYKLLISYDGTLYGGWQIQSNSTAIQELIEKALFTIFNTYIEITGSGRTDAGVHALEQVAHFSLDPPLKSLLKLRESLNGILPKEIRILQVEEAEPTFHARYSAKGKIYRYHIHNTRVMDPFSKNYGWHLDQPLNLEAMQEASRHLLGTHDFTSFANTGCWTTQAVRTLKRIDIKNDQGKITLEFEGDGFLYKMVRNLVGTLVDVGHNRIKPSEIPAILESKDRKQAGPSAPPLGLFLVKVHY